MEKIKYYGKDGLVAELESDEYALYALSKVLAEKLKEKMTARKAFVFALELYDMVFDCDENLVEESDMHELAAYFMMKNKIKSVEDALKDADDNIKSKLNIPGIDKDGILIAFAYYSIITHINELD